MLICGLCNGCNQKLTSEQILIRYFVSLFPVVEIIHGGADGHAIQMGLVVGSVNVRNQSMTEPQEVFCHHTGRIAALPGFLTHVIVAGGVQPVDGAEHTVLKPADVQLIVLVFFFLVYKSRKKYCPTKSKEQMTNNDRSFRKYL